MDSKRRTNVVEHIDTNAVVRSNLDADTVMRMRHATNLLKQFKSMYTLSENVNRTLRHYNEAKSNLSLIAQTKDGMDLLKRFLLGHKKETRRNEIPTLDNSTLIDKVIEDTDDNTEDESRRGRYIKRTERISLKAAPIGKHGEIGMIFTSVDPRTSSIERASKAFSAAKILLNYVKSSKGNVVDEHSNSKRKSVSPTLGSFKDVKPSTQGSFHDVKSPTLGSFHDVKSPTLGSFHDVRSPTLGSFHDVRSPTLGSFKDVKSTTQGSFKDVKSTTQGSFKDLKSTTQGILKDVKSPTEKKFDIPISNSYRKTSLLFHHHESIDNSDQAKVLESLVDEDDDKNIGPLAQKKDSLVISISTKNNNDKKKLNRYNALLRKYAALKKSQTAMIDGKTNYDISKSVEMSHNDVSRTSSNDDAGKTDDDVSRTAATSNNNLSETVTTSNDDVNKTDNDVSRTAATSNNNLSETITTSNDDVTETVTDENIVDRENINTTTHNITSGIRKTKKDETVEYHPSTPQNVQETSNNSSQSSSNSNNTFANNSENFPDKSNDSNGSEQLPKSDNTFVNLSEEAKIVLNLANSLNKSVNQVRNKSESLERSNNNFSNRSEMLTITGNNDKSGQFTMTAVKPKIKNNEAKHDQNEHVEQIMAGEDDRAVWKKQQDTLQSLREAKAARVKYEIAKHELAEKVKQLYVLANDYEKQETNDQILEVKNFISIADPENENTGPNEKRDEESHPGVALSGITNHNVDNVKFITDEDGTHKGFTMGAIDKSEHQVELKESQQMERIKKVYDLGLPSSVKLDDIDKSPSNEKTKVDSPEIKIRGASNKQEETLKVIAQAIQEDVQEITSNERKKKLLTSSISANAKSIVNVTTDRRDKQKKKEGAPSDKLDEYLSKALAEIMGNDNATMNNKKDEKDDKSDKSDHNKKIVEKAMRNHAVNPDLPLPLVNTKGEKMILNKAVHDNKTTEKSEETEKTGSGKSGDVKTEKSGESKIDKSDENKTDKSSEIKTEKKGENLNDIIAHVTDRDKPQTSLDLHDPVNKVLLDKASHMEEQVAAAQDKLYQANLSDNPLTRATGTTSPSVPTPPSPTPLAVQYVPPQLPVQQAMQPVFQHPEAAGFVKSDPYGSIQEPMQQQPVQQQIQPQILPAPPQEEEEEEGM